MAMSHFNFNKTVHHYTITETSEATLMKPYQVNIGRRASVEYSHANLTPLDFYLWGSLKEVVYHRKPSTLEKLQEEIETSHATIPVDTSAMVAHALVRQIQKCLQANGGDFEHLF
jgi:hypothetical protein